MKLFLKIFSALIISVFFYKASLILADSSYQIDTNSEYKIIENGNAVVTNTVTIKNLKSEYFPRQFIFNVTGIDPQNVKSYEQGVSLNTNVRDTSSGKSIIVDFVNRSVGKGSSKTFVISYQLSGLSKKTGEIWELVLPKISDLENYNSFKITLSVPDVFGEEAYVSPSPSSFTKVPDRKIYKFDSKESLEGGITAGFGIFQVFSFDINYHLEGNNQDPNQYIALPPDTSTQKLFYDSLEPRPVNIATDKNGNWLAQYKVPADKELNIKAKGYAQLFASPNSLSKAYSYPDPSDTSPTTYWQSDNPEIMHIAAGLNGPEDIYDYVVKNLSYNYKRVNSDYVRFGAAHVLENPKDALCMEFTDLFIALARAKKIPAREINGYAYSQNPSLEPLSLVSDVLHSWPEYWDSEKKDWIPVDPTWGNTTGGVDFFSKFDLRHFAFVVHGDDPIHPYSAGIYKTTGNPTKDISVSFAKMPPSKYPNVSIVSKNSWIIPYFLAKDEININNIGQTALYDFPVFIGMGKVTENATLHTFLPFTEYKRNIRVNYGFFALSTPEYISVTAGNLRQNLDIDKSRIIMGQLLVFLFLLLIIVIILHYKNHKSFYRNFNFARIANYVRRLFKKNYF